MGSGLKKVENLQFWPGFEPALMKKNEKYQKNIFCRLWDSTSGPLACKTKALPLSHCSTIGKARFYKRTNFEFIINASCLNETCTEALKIQNLEVSPNSLVQIGLNSVCNIPTLHGSTPYSQKLAKFKFDSKCPLGHCGIDYIESPLK